MAGQEEQDAATADDRSVPVIRVSLQGRVGGIYERVGAEWFVRLVERFYDGVETDPVLRPLYPDDLTASRRHLTLFLAQYFGGPADYNAVRGHPRLRMRHAPFTIGPAERDTWLKLMSAAVRAGGLGREDEAEMLSYFVAAAATLVNSEG